jgi:hypothetical protein
MLQVRNETPFVPRMLLVPNEQGIDTLYLMVKATFELQGNALRVAEQQCPLVLADEYWGEPGVSSLKYASEMHLLKPGTDVVLVGEAHAPGGRPTSSCLVSVRVGNLHKDIQVIGDRQWTGGLLAPRPSTPAPFLRMPLLYERAFGGTHEIDAEKGHVLAEPRNPVGRGFRGKRSSSQMVDRPLPNLEDPTKRISGISDAPEPMGVGYVAPSWLPRRTFAGTYDEEWRTRRAPYLPSDFKLDFFRMASAGLSSPEHLKGGEPVELLNVSPFGRQSFRLPRCGIEATVRIAGQRAKPSLGLETVLLEPGERRLCLLWRGALPCDKKALKVEEASFQLQSLEGVETSP